MVNSKKDQGAALPVPKKKKTMVDETTKPVIKKQPLLPMAEEVMVSGEFALAGDGLRPRRSVMDLSSLLDREGGEVEMCLTSEVVGDYLFEAKGAGGDISEPETEILSDHEEGKGSKENFNPAILARLRTNNNLCMMPVKMKKCSVSKREFFLRLKK